MDGEVNGQSAAERVMALRRPTVQTSIGVDHKIAAIEPGDLAMAVGGLQDLSRIATGEGRAPEEDQAARIEFATSQRGKEFFATIERVVRAGCIDPVYGTDRAAGPVVTDLPIDDQVHLYVEILKLSGYRKEAADKVRP